eukprot:TRINITY_DN6992_c0_g2_i2.p1 TRINITY_DN6992_c0_g2~~TRINITY_DN6992_c0_g2_i2.p1  ORF type:complete len:624 (-),score=69.78 TRINITY_DN6992_c0_g2_i2:181-2052(-)
MLEQLRRNHAIVVDALVATAESTACRPSTLLTTNWDELEGQSDVGVFVPCALSQVTISVSALDAGRGRQCKGGFASICYVLDLTTNKRHRHRAYEYSTNILPNAEVMLRNATVRLTRMLLLRGAFAGQYTHNEDGLWEYCNSPNFDGVTPEDAYFGEGMTGWLAMVKACRQTGWKLYGPALKEWVLFPAVERNGKICQRRSAKAELAAASLLGVGRDLGFHPDRWGWWSLRKKVSEDIASSGHPEDAARMLQHGNIVRDTVRDEIYRDTGHCRDLAYCSTSSKVQLPVANQRSFSAFRVPASRARSVADVPDGSAAWKTYFVESEEVKKAEGEWEQNMAQLVALVKEYLPAEPNYNPEADGGDPSNYARWLRGQKKNAWSDKVWGKWVALQRMGLTFIAHGHPAYTKALTELSAGDVVTCERRFRKIFEKCSKARLAFTQARERQKVKALKQVRREVFDAGQEELRLDEALRAERMRSEDWPDMDEDTAVCYSLDRPDLSDSWRHLRKMPHFWRQFILDIGAPHLVDKANMWDGFTLRCKRCGQTSPAPPGSRQSFNTKEYCGCGAWYEFETVVEMPGVLKEFPWMKEYSNGLKRPAADLYKMWRSRGFDDHAMTNDHSATNL